MAVYTDVSDAELEAFLAEYDIGEADSFKGIAEGVENSNYLLATSTGQYILTLYEKRVDPRELPFFLGLLDHLAARGITCPRADSRSRRAGAADAGRQAGGGHELPARPVAAPHPARPLRAGRRGAGRPPPRRPGLPAAAAQRPVGRRLAAAVRGLAPLGRRPRPDPRARGRARLPRSQLADRPALPASSMPTCSTTTSSSCTTGCRA